MTRLRNAILVLVTTAFLVACGDDDGWFDSDSKKTKKTKIKTTTKKRR